MQRYSYPLFSNRLTSIIEFAFNKSEVKVHSEYMKTLHMYLRLKGEIIII